MYGEAIRNDSEMYILTPITDISKQDTNTLQTMAKEHKDLDNVLKELQKRMWEDDFEKFCHDCVF